MKTRIVFFGDSITDAGRNRDSDNCLYSYGNGYVRDIAGELLADFPSQYEIINRGVSGDRCVDLYARIKKDVWTLSPDVLSILIGVNDVWHELWQNGVDTERYERIYEMVIKDTLERLPDLKIIIMEPFVLKGTATSDNWELFSTVCKYADIGEKLAKKYNLPFVKTQAVLNEANKNFTEGELLSDGVHPNVAGAAIIAEEWLKTFYRTIK